MVKKGRSQANLFKKWNAEHPLIAISALCLLTTGLSCLLPLSPQQSGLGWGMAVCAAVLLAAWEILTGIRRIPQWGHSVCWWGIGFFLRFSYILHFPYYLMQHDVLRFSGETGHAGYILYLFREGHLPDFDVRSVWQFYHPPLHHLLTAGWMHLTASLPTAQWYETAQALPFAYSCAALAVFGLILRELGCKGLSFTLPFAVMAVHPGLIILSGSINNDMLSILLMECALLLTLRWQKAHRMSTILLLALSIGLGMMAKLSAWLAAPAAAAVFLHALWKEKGAFRRLWGQFAAFAAVCFPLGLFWSVRNFLGWGVPPMYIPMLSSDSEQYVGMHPIWERLFDVSPRQFTYIYDCFTIYGQDYSEYNPLIGLLKTAVFDEFVNTSRFPAVQGFGEVLFWTQVVLCLLCIAAILRVLRRKGLRGAQVVLLITYASALCSYLLFCLTYAHTCTQSFRYAVPTLYASLAFGGICLREKPLPCPAQYAVTAAVCGFAGVSLLIYGVLLYIP